MHRSILLLLAIAATGCTRAPDVAPDRRAAAERWVAQDVRPDTLRPVAIWYANGNPASSICGEIEAPASLRDHGRTLRYVYDPNTRRPYGQVERHAGWIAIGATTTALLDANRRIFDDLWAEHCAGAAPLDRRLAAWTGIDLDALGLVVQAPRERSVEELRAEVRASGEIGRKLGEDG